MKRIKLFGLVVCLIFIANLRAQVMDTRWEFNGVNYRDNNKTADVQVGFCGMYDKNYPYGLPWYENFSTIIYPDQVVNPNNGETYTVTGIVAGFTIGWKVNKSWGGDLYCDIPFKIYIPKTVTYIQNATFQKSIWNTDPSIESTGNFIFYFEDEDTYEAVYNFYKYGINNNGDLINKITNGFFLPPQVHAELYTIISIEKWDRSNETSIQNVTVSNNVKYRIENGGIYFDEAVKNAKLYDVNGKLLYSNSYGTQLNVGNNNPKGVYLLKYDNKAVKIVF